MRKNQKFADNSGMAPLFPEWEKENLIQVEKTENSEAEVKSKSKEKQEKDNATLKNQLDEALANLKRFEKKSNELSEKVDALEKEKAALEKSKEELEKNCTELKPKADAYEALLSSESFFPVNIVAKSFGWSAIYLNQYLQKKRIQYKHGDVWVLYQQYAGKGYTTEMWNMYYDRQGKPRYKAHTYWTMKGLEFIRSLVKADEANKE